MSVLIPSKPDSKPAEKKAVTKSGSRNRKSKKEYVYKFWAALSKHCEPVMNEYMGKLQQKQMNSLKSGQNGTSDAKTASETKTETTTESAEGEESGISFEELGAFMANKQLIVLVGKFWALLRACVNKEGIRKESIKDARIILSTLMISMFPSDLLDAADANDMDPLSRRCYTAAQRVLMKVFILKDKVSKTKVHCQEAYKAIGDFLDAFKDWQTQDKTKLIKIGLNQYEQWQRSYHVIKLTNMNQGQKEGVLKVIETNIKNMKERILKVLDGNQDKMNQLCSEIDEKLKIEQAEAAQHCQVPTRAEPQAQAQPQSQAEAPNQTATTSSPKQAPTTATAATTSGTSDSSVISSTTMASAQNNGDNGDNGDHGDHEHDQQSPKRSQGRQKGVNHEEKTPPKVKNEAARQQDQQQQQQQTIEEKLRARGVPVNMKTGRNSSGNNSFSNSPASNNFGFNYYSDSEEKKSDNENNDNNNNNVKSSRFVTEINGSKFLNLDAIIMEEASRKYWLDFEKEISNENWSRLFELLTEILSRVKKLSPKKDGKMLDDMIDVKFLQQTIEHGLVDASGFYGIYFGIWKQLKSLHAPARDDAWDKWHDETLENMSKPDATWGKLLSSVFNTFLMKIDEIEDQTKAIYESVNKKNSKK